MASAFGNLLYVGVSSTPGTDSTISLGSEVPGFRPVSDVITHGQQVSYSIEDGLNREVGRATYSTTYGPQLINRTPLVSTAGASTAINASATARVSITILAEDIADLYKAMDDKDAALGNTKANVTNPTIQGSLRVRNYTGDVNKGVVYLGDSDRYLYYDGTKFILGNAPLTAHQTITIDNSSGWAGVLLSGNGTGDNVGIYGNDGTVNVDLLNADMSWKRNNFSIYANGDFWSYGSGKIGGGLEVQNGAIRVQGNGGDLTQGIVYFGSGNHYIHKLGTTWYLYGGDALNLSIANSIVLNGDRTKTNSKIQLNAGASNNWAVYSDGDTAGFLRNDGTWATRFGNNGDQWIQHRNGWLSTWMGEKANLTGASFNGHVTIRGGGQMMLRHATSDGYGANFFLDDGSFVFKVWDVVNARTAFQFHTDGNIWCVNRGYIWDAINARAEKDATYAGRFYSPYGNGQMVQNYTGGSYEIRNQGGTGDWDMAMINFHARGTYGINLGLRNDGYFGLGGWSSAAWRWYSAANGDMVASGNVAAYSDPRLKDDVERINGALDILDQLDGVRFTWNHKTKLIGRPGVRDVGILADQVEKVLPEIVSLSIEDIENDNERWRIVAYDKLIPVVIEGVKELRRENQMLKAQLENVLVRLSELEARSV